MPTILRRLLWNFYGGWPKPCAIFFFSIAFADVTRAQSQGLTHATESEVKCMAYEEQHGLDADELAEKGARAELIYTNYLVSLLLHSSEVAAAPVQALQREASIWYVKTIASNMRRTRLFIAL